MRFGREARRPIPGTDFLHSHRTRFQSIHSDDCQTVVVKTSESGVGEKQNDAVSNFDSDFSPVCLPYRLTPDSQLRLSPGSSVGHIFRSRNQSSCEPLGNNAESNFPSSWIVETSATSNALAISVHENRLPYILQQHDPKVTARPEHGAKHDDR